MEKIAAGLERAFATSGFAKPSIDDLRDEAGVSLRTLYKYVPSRGEMMCAALEYRHRRYMTMLFDDLPTAPEAALLAIIDRIANWMQTEATHGCLFHAAVAAAPNDPALRALLEKNKTEVATKTARLCDLAGKEVELSIILDGLTQSWPLYGGAAVDAAKRLAGLLWAERHAPD